MVTLLSRQPSDRELLLQRSLRKILPTLPKVAFSLELCRSLGLENPSTFFAAILSLIGHPPSSPPELALCRYLLGIPVFYPYISDPAHFGRPAMVALYRTLMRIDHRFDIKLVSALVEWEGVNQEVMLHALSVLDETSPGGRLTMTLARVAREAEPEVASKVALLMGRRVSNPMWVERNLASGDARTRANVIESLWGVNTDHAKKSLISALRDSNNRVVGNALVGLHLLGDQLADAKIRQLADHPEPNFRATVAWVMGKTGKPTYRDLLAMAREDADERVSAAANRALALLPPPDPSADEAAGQVPAVDGSGEAKTGDSRKPEEENFQFHLDGSYGRRVSRR